MLNRSSHLKWRLQSPRRFLHQCEASGACPMILPTFAAPAWRPAGVRTKVRRSHGCTWERHSKRPRRFRGGVLKPKLGLKKQLQSSPDIKSSTCERQLSRSCLSILFGGSLKRDLGVSANEPWPRGIHGAHLSCPAEYLPWGPPLRIVAFAARVASHTYASLSPALLAWSLPGP